MQYELFPFSYSSNPKSPAVEAGKESIRLDVTDMSYDGSLLQLEFQATFLFPSSVRDRYDDLGEAMVLVVNDVEQGDCIALRTFNEFMNFGRDTRGGPNMKAPPSAPLPPRGSLAADTYAGGFLGGALSLNAPSVADRPTVFVYLVLENYVSNVIGINLHSRQSVHLS